MNKKTWIWIAIISTILIFLAVVGFFWFIRMNAKVLYGAPLYRPNQ